MGERLLSVDEEPHRPGSRYRALRVNGVWACHMLHDRAGLARAELDRLYAAAEANQAPGPDWKAKLREEVEAERRPGSVEFAWFLALIDALPDPPTPDPDAPPVYVPPEGHYIVLGENVRDGWEGRPYTGGPWWSAEQCRDLSTTLFEVRRVPAPEPATEWVPLHRCAKRGLPGKKGTVGTFSGDAVGRFAAVLSTGQVVPLHVRDDGCVEVLAEGER